MILCILFRLLVRFTSVLAYSSQASSYSALLRAKRSSPSDESSSDSPPAMAIVFIILALS